MIGAAVAWILGYWTRELGRAPAEDDIEPWTRVLWDAGQRVSAADYLLAVEDLQEFSRRVATFLTDVDVWMTPTLSTPPLPIGQVGRSPESVRYAGVIANITGSPAMSVPLSWNEDGLPIGVHFLGRFGDEATLFRLASQLECARPWADRWPPVNALGR
jgi:amidase